LSQEMNIAMPNNSTDIMG